MHASGQLMHAQLSSSGDAIELEAILPPPATAVPLGPRRVAWLDRHSLGVRVALFLAGFILLQCGLWSAAADSAWVFSTPGWLCFVGWAFAQQKVLSQTERRSRLLAEQARLETNQLAAGMEPEPEPEPAEA